MHSQVNVVFKHVGPLADAFADSLAKQGIDRSFPFVVSSLYCCCCFGIMLLYHCFVLQWIVLCCISVFSFSWNFLLPQKKKMQWREFLHIRMYYQIWYDIDALPIPKYPCIMDWILFPLLGLLFKACLVKVHCALSHFGHSVHATVIVSWLLVHLVIVLTIWSIGYLPDFRAVPTSCQVCGASKS